MRFHESHAVVSMLRPLEFGEPFARLLCSLSFPSPLSLSHRLDTAECVVTSKLGSLHEPLCHLAVTGRRSRQLETKPRRAEKAIRRTTLIKPNAHLIGREEDLVERLSRVARGGGGIQELDNKKDPTSESERTVREDTTTLVKA